MSFRADVPGEFDLFDLHRLAPERYPYLLQSVAGHPVSGRYDILFAFPGERVPARNFFSELTQAYASERLREQADTDLPFVGGWFLLLGYEAVAQIEPTLALPRSPFRLPDALAVRCRGALIYDRERKCLHLYSESSSRQLHMLERDVAVAKALPPLSGRLQIEPAIEDSPEQHLANVGRVLEYLRAGDIFQANLSRAWRARLYQGDYLQLYARLRRSNPSPFAGLVLHEDTAVVSSSPERLLRIQNGIAEARPIAGTRPRGRDAQQDEALKQRLIGNLKERAEHVMLIDLERNDLGRVCLPGSVEVNELMTIESYAHVHHIVSNVRGRLRPDVGPGEALQAVFPGGTITGCPKVRSIEILAELEGVGRGPYTGAMGYLSRCGRLDTNILIRTLVCEDGVVSFRAGGGIVADSDPEAELAETRAKARGLLLALSSD